ncbi:MAG: methyltransferase [Gammaproteobacteria bacterium]|nr:methyltransferase [Gammaproteobacteria bacterium]
MSDDLFQTAFGEFHLQPLHHHPRSPLQAWNAADDLLLQELANRGYATDTHPRTLLVNDGAGALGIALHNAQPQSWNDSFSAHLALQKNLQRNALPEDCVHFIPAHQSPDAIYDCVLIQLPKTLSLLEHQLTQLRNHVHENTLIIGGGMVKHMAKSMIELFEKIIGPTHTSLAEKKARLVFAQFNPALPATAPAPVHYAIPGSPLQLVNLANVFSRQQLDIGTRFLLEQLPDLKGARSILDLGCGNGALGIYAGWKNPQATLHFTDDSFLAVQSARESLALNRLENPAHFHCGDGLEQFDGKVDAILCNPPFHEGNKVHTEIAARMFRDAARHLNPEGTFYVVANRHLDYLPQLRTRFHHCQLIASNAKFVILGASKPGSG